MQISRFSSLVLIATFATLSGPSCAFGQNTNEAVKAGAVLFRDKGCTFCHGAGGVGSKKAPSLAGVPGDKVWTPEKITDQILNGGQKMPPFRDSVTDEEVTELIAYLRAKNKPVPPPLAADGAPAGTIRASGP